MKRLPVCGWLVLALAGTGYGQEPVDPPSRVARLNFIAGNVAYRPANIEDWAPATMNYPLTTGDHLWTDEQGGAEMHIGSTALRIAGSTSFAILNLDDRITQVSVAQGFVNVRLRRLEPGETFEVDTPNGAIALIRPGDYRVGVDPEGNATMVFVRGGGAEVTGGNRTFPVDQDQEVRFVGTDQVDAESLEPPSPDQWDDWCASRDREDDRAEEEVAPYVGNGMIGAEDLAGNGQWRTDPEYGRYWVPTRVAVDWAPYRYGHWAYVMPWGWTWIDDAPWGFAPFHYGRWAMIGGGWAWVPGAVVARPVYAPALVAFVGGRNFGVSIGIGGGVGVAAWIPLGPREVYRPYYPVSNTYIRNVNVTHVTNINVTNVNVTNVNYVNRTYVTAVRQDTFVGARSVSSGYVRVPPSAVAQVQRVDVASVRPAREAYLGRPVGGMRVATPPATVINRTVIARTPPPATVQAAPIRVTQANTIREVPRGYSAGGQQGNQRGGYNRSPINTPNTGNRPNFSQPQYQQRNTGNQTYQQGNSGNQIGNRPNYNPQSNTGNQTGGNPTGIRPNYNPQVNTGNQTVGNQTGNQPKYKQQINTGNQTGNNPSGGTNIRPNYTPQTNTGNQSGGNNQPGSSGRQPRFDRNTTVNQGSGNQSGNPGGRPAYNQPSNTVQQQQQQQHQERHDQQKKTTDDKKK